MHNGLLLGNCAGDGALDARVRGSERSVAGGIAAGRANTDHGVECVDRERVAVSRTVVISHGQEDRVGTNLLEHMCRGSERTVCSAITKVPVVGECSLELGI